jgi:hypothetical protein
MPASSDLYENDLRKSTKELMKSLPVSTSPEPRSVYNGVGVGMVGVRDGEMLVIL